MGHTLKRIPYMLVVGDKEMEAGEEEEVLGRDGTGVPRRAQAVLHERGPKLKRRGIRRVEGRTSLGGFHCCHDDEGGADVSRGYQGVFDGQTHFVGRAVQRLEDEAEGARESHCFRWTQMQHPVEKSLHRFERGLPEAYSSQHSCSWYCPRRIIYRRLSHGLQHFQVRRASRTFWFLRGVGGGAAHLVHFE